MIVEHAKRLMRARVAAVIAGWLLMWLLTWPALFASFQKGGYADYRANLGASMMLALMPPMWIMTPFLTGFYEYGFQISPSSRYERRRP